MSTDARVPLPQIEPPADAPADTNLYARVSTMGTVPEITLVPVPPTTTVLVPWTATVGGVPELMWDDDDNLMMIEVTL